MNKMEQCRRTLAASSHWANRRDMVNQAIGASLPWLASVNIAFAMLVALRNLLFPVLTPRCISTPLSLY
ncbi:Uncharacterised protein [Serratia rubidaea]|uniref:Uncharacterized protein n=1 Tax=Serratia rubidaea TaxID=61652 RepID=A0A4U9HFX2_SERRU|nr:Uncharacterised protein [Serratia rubidaea]